MGRYVMSEQRKLEIITEAQKCGFKLMISRFIDIGGPNVVNLIRSVEEGNIPSRDCVVSDYNCVIVTEKEVIFHEGVFTPYVYGLIEEVFGEGIECPDDGEEALAWLKEKAKTVEERDVVKVKKLQKAISLLKWTIENDGLLTQISIRENGEILLFSARSNRVRRRR